jgi:hypothetical protein
MFAGSRILDLMRYVQMACCIFTMERDRHNLAMCGAVKQPSNRMANFLCIVHNHAFA